MTKYFRFKERKLEKLVRDICDEHLKISRIEDTNMGYLWYMYAEGTKKGDFKPFIFLAEINLLLATGYITEIGKENLIGMISSEDDDNLYLAAYSILTFREKRIKEKGEWIESNQKYFEINYTRDIINPELFIKTN